MTSTCHSECAIPPLPALPAMCYPCATLEDCKRKKHTCLPPVMEDSLPYGWKFFLRQLSTKNSPIHPQMPLFPGHGPSPGFYHTQRSHISARAFHSLLSHNQPVISFLLSPLGSLLSCHTSTIHTGQATCYQCPVMTLEPLTLPLLSQALEPQHTTGRSQLCLWPLFTGLSLSRRSTKDPMESLCASVSQHPGFQNAGEMQT